MSEDLRARRRASSCALVVVGGVIGAVAAASCGGGGDLTPSTDASVDAATETAREDSSATDVDAASDASEASDAPAESDGDDAAEVAPVPCAAGDAGAVATGTLPKTLSATGLYADITAKTIATAVRTFAPTYVLWSDGATKTRWVRVPDSCAIDTSDMDHWVLPVGTYFWKEFVVDGKRIETRLIARFGPGESDFVMGAYLWRDDESDADLVPFGAPNARGTTHDVPAQSFCKACHGYLPERALGFSALQLDHAGSDVTLSLLVAEKRLSVPPTKTFRAPGDAVTANALGYLHANCGNCHNAYGIKFITPFRMRLSVLDATPEATDTWKTAVNVPVEKVVLPGVERRIAPKNATGSCVHQRMSIRGSTEQMPPIASKIVDDAGVATIAAWINAIPP